MIVQELHEIQHRHGFLPREELETLASRIKTPLHRLHEVASFFPHFRFDPPAKVTVHVCRDLSCHHLGGGRVRTALETRCQSLCEEGKVHIGGVSCLGRCDRAPAVMINEKLYAARSVDDMESAIKSLAEGRTPPPPDTDEGYTACNPTPWQVDPYEGTPRYDVAKRLLRELDGSAEDVSTAVQRVISSLETATLLGMGGAGMPTFQKWRDVLNARGTEKYVVCNADESEPATFKDRELLLRTPHLIIEGMVVAGLLFGATRGYVYVRHEYPEQIRKMRAAIRQAEQMGVCGERVGRSGRSFPMEVFVSPGGYICGEQTALIEAMEDKRAEPRNRPPSLETNGLFDKPTLVNNVETFAWVPAILFREDGTWYRDAGKYGWKGRRFFSISGDVNRPGVYEVPIGVTMREFIEEYAQGIKDGRELKAFAPSGPSGGLLPRRIPIDTLATGWEKRVPERFLKERVPPGTTALDLYDLEMDLNLFRNLGLMLGAGVVAYGPQTDVVRESLNALEFFRNESCGKCVPCRIGSQKLVEIGTHLARSRFSREAFSHTEELITELARAMELTSICGLGSVASNPMTSLVRYFRSDVESYLKGVT